MVGVPLMAWAVARRRLGGDVLADLGERPVDQAVRHRIGLGLTCGLVRHHVTDGNQLRLGERRINTLGFGMPVAVTGTLDGIYEGVEAWVI